MKRLVKVAVLLSVMAVAALSCVNDDITEPVGEELLEMLPSVEEQVSMMEASLSDIVELEKAARPHGLVLAEASEVLKSHVAVLKAGVTMEKGTLATLDVQKKLAGVLGQAAAGLDGEVKKTLGPSLDEINAGICAWLGESFASYYPVAEAESRMKVLMSGLCETMDMQELYADALVSDVEAGLRKDEKPEELARLVESVGQNSELADELEGSLSSLAAETEKEYRAALTGLFADPASFDAQALGEFNAGVETEVKSAAATLSDLMNRVAACDAKLEDIKARLGAIEADINQLLEMIQSVEYMPDNDSYTASALYDLDPTKASAYEGKKQRTPAGTIDMSFLVRPAAASGALAAADIRNNGMSVVGYYADGQPVGAGSMTEFTISDVVVNVQAGIVKVKVANELAEAFYFKESAVRMALSLTTGKADLTSRFVDVVPKDRSGNVYVETVRLSSTSIEVDNGQSVRLSAELSPEGVTTGGVVWKSSNEDIATVGTDGTVTGKSVGTVTVTATTNSTDEWGNKLTATCSVKVCPSVKLLGADFVEEGSQMTMEVQSPNYISPEYVKWEVGTFTSKNASGEPAGFSTNQAFASIDENGKLTGLKMYYNTSDAVKDYVPLMVKCTIEGAMPVVLYHEVRVVAVQPKGITINNIPDTDTQTSTKQGVALDLSASIKPDNVNSEYFKLAYSFGFDNGYFSASTVGHHYVTYSVQPGGTGQYNYFYPKGRKLDKNFSVVVEPYYVKTVSLPATFDMEPGQTATLLPEFTSDVDGKSPTFTELRWMSSDPAIVSIDETTGEMTSHKAGTVSITATTSHANAVPSGQSQKTAECVVTVKTPVAPIEIGDYYYSDGTWSTDLVPGKTVYGIVFAKVNATGTDSHLRKDYSGCVHGLVVSIKEYSSVFVNSGRQWSLADIATWCTAHGYTSYWDQTNPCGYTNTKGYMELNAANYVGYGNNVVNYTMFNASSPIASHRSSYAVPPTASAWYVPSYKEMQILHENMEVVNQRISSVGGNQVQTDRYLTSTNDWDNKSLRVFDMSSNSWYGFAALESSAYPVRVILAF